MTRDEIVDEARTWLGTPWHHQARVKHVGVDCVGVIIKVAHHFGISDFDILDYSRIPDPVQMKALLDQHLIPITKAEVLPADILWLRVKEDPQHLAIVSRVDPMMVIHAFNRRGIDKVVETHAGAFWDDRVIGCYRYPGL